MRSLPSFLCAALLLGACGSTNAVDTSADIQQALPEIRYYVIADT